MSTPYDGPERRMYDAANRRLALNFASNAIRTAYASQSADVREAATTAARAHFAGTPDAEHIERIIADALGARVATPTENT